MRSSRYKPPRPTVKREINLYELTLRDRNILKNTYNYDIMSESEFNDLIKTHIKKINFEQSKIEFNLFKDNFFNNPIVRREQLRRMREFLINIERKGNISIKKKMFALFLDRVQY